MTKRIYCVSDGNTDRLVRAHHPSAAIKHVADGTITARVAGQDDLVALLQAGMEIEEAGQKPAADAESADEAGVPETDAESPDYWPEKGKEMVGEDDGPMAA